ncbi:CYTH domain-containing protein [Halpernia frigidisoli]|uniref:CYTH domain-containing protein n=1 Tax=Halpernia frigidisoli TaxID=1125876 RepID=A0A1I3D9B1_9FLAO|nr:CYTH domain-containing protein [Halpernia frigidisoli]SFH83317.1 CYTH domain-containing protein [Halpernia frigidisoli]
MGIEIERKFLVNREKWQYIEKPTGEKYRQGYLVTDPKKTIRVRQTIDKGFLTIKGISIGAKRSEFEYEIPFEEARELLDQFSVAELSKIRYKILFDNHIWEIDEFFGDNKGLIVAEIELKTEEENFTIPEWIDREVTEDEKYYNSNLVLKPFKDWKI